MRLAAAILAALLAAVLAPGARASYVVFVRKNRLLDVRVEGVRGRDVVARIVRAADGVAIDARTKEGVRTWSGRLPEDGDYRIDVVRLAREPHEPIPFTLLV